MASEQSEFVRWDVAMALRDVCMEMYHFHSKGRAAEADTVRQWHEWIVKSLSAHNALAHACEDLVEEGVTEERLAAMKVALTHAMGQDQYWAREHRW